MQRALQEEADAGVKVAAHRPRRRRRDRRGGRASRSRRARRHAQGRALGAHARSRSRPRKRSSKGKKKTVTYFVEEKEEGVDEEEVVRAPRIKKESVETRHPHRGGAPRARHAGRHAQGRAEPARRRRARAFGSGAARSCGARRPQDTRVYVDGVADPGALPRRRPALDGELGSGQVDRPRRPARTAPTTAAASAAWCTVETRTLAREGMHGSVAADVIDASAMVTAAPTPARARRRRRRATATSTARSPRSTSTDVGDFVPDPALLRRPGAWRSSSSRKDEDADVLRPPRSDDTSTRTIASRRSAAVRTEKTHDGVQARARLRYARAARRRRERHRDAVRRRRRHRRRWSRASARADRARTRRVVATALRAQLPPQAARRRSLTARARRARRAARSVSRIGSITLPRARAT